MALEVNQHRRWMPAGKMAELLSRVPPDAQVEVNRVGNLSFYQPGDGFIGYLDIAPEDLVLFSDDETRKETDSATEADPLLGWNTSSPAPSSFAPAKMRYAEAIYGRSGELPTNLWAVAIPAGTDVDPSAALVSQITPDMRTRTKISGVRYDGPRLFLGDIILKSCDGSVSGVLIYEPTADGEDGLPILGVPCGDQEINGGDLVLQWHGLPALILPT